MGNANDFPIVTRLRAKCFDIEAGKNIVVFNEEEAREIDVGMSERVSMRRGDREMICIVDLSSALVGRGEIGLFADVSERLGARTGETIEVKPVNYPVSIDYIKKKMDGRALSREEIDTVVHEMMEDKLSEIELASFITSTYIRGMSIDETVYLTEAIAASGGQLNLGVHPVVDKHCSGGVAGNRTTMVLVPIIAAAGLYIPKTSSRSITSAAGTADTMEVLAPVEFGLEEMREIVLRTHGCMVWGGAINLAVADDRMIRVRHSMRLDPKGVLLSSILAKKKSVGAEYVVIDIPVGRGTKIEDLKEANALARDFLEISAKLGMKTECFITDGSDPIGEGIGPALECRDVLRSLRNEGPSDLTDKSCQLAGALLELCGEVSVGRGNKVAMDLIKSGKAYAKMMEIVEAQGGNPKVRADDLPIGGCRHAIKAMKGGRVQHVDNKTIAKIARAAGAPKDKGAGVILHCEHGDKVRAGDVLLEIVACSESKLDFAIKIAEMTEPVELQKVVLKTVRD